MTDIKKKQSIIDNSLSDSDAEQLREAFGRNEISEKKRVSFPKLFLKNLGDPVIRILLGALILNILFMLRGKDWHEGLGIAISVICATLISSVSEYKRDSAFDKLKSTVGGEYKVMRAGDYATLHAQDLVVGDIIEISSGERIPADCMLISGSLRVNQAPLTGESEEVEKEQKQSEAHKLFDLIHRFLSGEKCEEAIKKSASDLSPSDSFAIFNGCFVTSGIGIAVVTAVGNNTKLGKISESLGEDEKSPLRERLDVLAKQISIIGYIASALIALAYLFNTFVIDSGFSSAIILAKLSDIRLVISELFSAFTLALTVIVVAVPEGLPMMIAVVLARNSGKMAKDNVLVRHAPGIEAAGCMNILFTDKTGTLTCGEPKVCSVITPYGEFRTKKAFASASNIGEEMLALCAAYNSAAAYSRDGKIISQNTAEHALLEFSVPKERRLQAERISFEPFDSVKKYSSATVRYKSKKYTFYKGAPEILLRCARSFISPEGKILPLNTTEFEKQISAHSKEGERILLCAIEDGSALTVICAVAMRDPLRAEAERAVSDLTGAGIHVVMITGDGRETAERIAENCKILTKKHCLSLSGSELNEIDDNTLAEKLSSLAVVYRALPEHKLRLVRAAKLRNLTVGMTGDGLNDAPALKAADCGFALGCGTEVSKNASDIIILDNDLSSVVNAVMHGRNIFKSIRKFITLQLIMNFTAMAVSMAGPFIGIEAPVTVVQMLWINIVMDTLGGLAFAGEHAERRLLKEKPKLRDEPVIDKATRNKVARLSILSSILCFIFLKSKSIQHLFDTTEGSIYHLTAFFAFFIFTAALNCFNARSDRLNLFAGISKNPTFIAIIGLVSTVQVAFIYLGASIMRTVPLEINHLLLTVALALPVIAFEFLAKVWGKLSPRGENKN